jgi:hypothetical protein
MTLAFRGASKLYRQDFGFSSVEIAHSQSVGTGKAPSTTETLENVGILDEEVEEAPFVVDSRFASASLNMFDRS